MNEDELNSSVFLNQLPQLREQGTLLDYTAVSQEFFSDVPLPIAKVWLDIPLLHMSGVFDYEVPTKFAQVPVGARVQVNVGAKRVTGYIIERVSTTTIANKLRQIFSVPSYEAVLSPEIIQVIKLISARTITPVADSLRLAIPARHATVEREFRQETTAKQDTIEHDSYSDSESANALSGLSVSEVINKLALPLQSYENGQELVSYILEHADNNCANRANAVTEAENSSDSSTGIKPNIHNLHLLPRETSENLFAPLCQHLVQLGRQVLFLMPTAAQAALVQQSLNAKYPDLRCLIYSGQDIPKEKYRKFLTLKNGLPAVVIGTRSAAWLPLPKLSFSLIYDEAHSAYKEQRSPYLTAREILLTRSEVSGTPVVCASHAPNLWAAHWTKATSGITVTPKLAVRSQNLPQVLGLNDFPYEKASWSRMPQALFTTVREGLLTGSVLLVVPKAGYIPQLVCVNCQTQAQCRRCAGKVGQKYQGHTLSCNDCGTQYPSYRCVTCGGEKLRAARIGSQRTAQEIGVSFPNTPIVLAHAGHELKPITGNKLVIATPGAEPEVENGYASAVLMDAGYLLAAEKLNSEHGLLRTAGRIMRRLAPGRDKSKFLILGNIPTELIDTIGRWEFSAWEEENLALRRELALPPTAKWYTVTGEASALQLLLSLLKQYIHQLFPTSSTDLTPSFDTLALGLAEYEILPGIAVMGPKILSTKQYQIMLRAVDTQLDLAALLGKAKRECILKYQDKTLQINADPDL